MKSIKTILYTALSIVLFLQCMLSMAQAPEKVSYQSVIRDASGELVRSQSVGVQISILQGSVEGDAVYIETHNPTTNINGLATMEVGSGTTVSGTFSEIDWSNSPYFLKVETDPTGGTSYTVTGTSEILSTPYALYAKKAQTVEIETQDISGIATNAADITTLQEEQSTQDAAIALNTAKVGITPTQSDAIIANSGKDTTGICHANRVALDNVSGINTGDQDISGIAINASDITTLQGEQTTQDADIALNTAKVGYTDALVAANSAVAANTAKVGLTPGTTTGQMLYWNGTAWVTVSTGNAGQNLTVSNGIPSWSYNTTISNVTNPTTGKVWMDRNLGATQVATSSTDADAYGDLYQWGRGADGHQIRTSATTSTLSSTDAPGHGNFILSPSDWRSPKNDNLWQGVNGVNNPCPAGYRIPTKTEMDAECASWSTNNAAGAFASPLKLSVTGNRVPSSGSLGDVGYGSYWSSTVDGIYSHRLIFNSGNANVSSTTRAYGFSVRCIKDLDSYSETDPIYLGSQAANITEADITNLGNLSGENSGNQDISGIAINASDITTLQGEQITQDADIALNTAKETNVSTALSSGSITATTYGITTDGSTDDIILPEATSSTAGLLGAAKWNEINANTAKIGQTPGTSPGQMQYWNGTAWIEVSPTVNEGATLQMIRGVPTWIGGTPPPPSVTNPTTGKIWMDRNLGATQVADSCTDADSYGDLYQWGRGADGHQIRTSATTSTLSATDVPGHDNFILPPSFPNNWRSTQNDNLWQGVNGVNNPCPAGYRIPTDTELDAERLSWISQDSLGAFVSPLKLSMAGDRSYGTGLPESVGSAGYYWSSIVDGTRSRILAFYASTANIYSLDRAYGSSVRCIKD